jgi:hypothetical protein
LKITTEVHPNRFVLIGKGINSAKVDTYISSLTLKQTFGGKTAVLQIFFIHGTILILLKNGLTHTHKQITTKASLRFNFYRVKTIHFLKSIQM